MTNVSQNKGDFAKDLTQIEQTDRQFNNNHKCNCSCNPIWHNCYYISYYMMPVHILVIECFPLDLHDLTHINTIHVDTKLKQIILVNRVILYYQRWLSIY